MVERNTARKSNPDKEINNDVARIEAGPKTVTVACKLPHGLILRLFSFRDETHPVVGGGTRDVKVPYPTGDQVRINGNAVPHGEAPRYTILGGGDQSSRGLGFALTENVDAAFFAKWLHDNKDHPAVREKLIWAYSDPADLRDAARDLEDTRNGVEPLNPDGDPRAPRGVEKGSRDNKASQVA